MHLRNMLKKTILVKPLHHQTAPPQAAEVKPAQISEHSNQKLKLEKRKTKDTVQTPNVRHSVSIDS